MGRRWSARKSFRHRVVIESAHIARTVVTTRDMSLNGMFIETGPIFLPLYTPVSVLFSFVQPELRLKAKVARWTYSGSGLTFTDLKPEDRHTLGAVLYLG